MESSGIETKQIDIKSICELCQALDCCPEHCCNWDTCKCKSCQGCMKRRREADASQQQTDPSILIKSTGTEEVKKIKKKEAEKMIDEKKPKQLARPQEQTRANDGALITNYEVPVEDDEDKVVYAGGIRGIRALRHQREALNGQIQEDLDHVQQRNKFQSYEQQRKPQHQSEEESKR